MSELSEQSGSLEQVREFQRRAELWERQYRSLAESLPDGMLTCDEAGNVLSSNSAGAELTGFHNRELLRMNVRQLLTPGSYQNVASLLEQATPSNPHFSTEAELVTRHGARVPMELHAGVIEQAASPRVVHYVLREKRAEPGFRGNRHDDTGFRLLANNLAEMVLAYDIERRLTFANPAAETLTGYSLAELEQRRFLSWVHPGDRERMEGLRDRLFAGKSFSEEEYRLITKDGRMKWVAASWAPIVDEAGRQVGIHGRERDITEHRMAEDTRRHSQDVLHESEERYRGLFENSPFPMWEQDFSWVKEYLNGLAAGGVVNLRGHLAEHPDELAECLRRIRVLDVNRAAREFYGADRKDELFDLTRIFDDTAYETFAEELAVLAASNSPFKAEFQTRTLKGEPRTVTMIVSIAPNRANDWSRVIVSFFDISDRKQWEGQFLQSQKLESLGRLAGGVAHDFNNLLTVINGYTDVVLNALDADNPLRRHLVEVRNAGTRGAELTQQLLAFSRRQVSQMKPLDLNALIRASEEMLKRVIGEDIRLVVSLDPACGTVKGDQGHMHQVLMNLVVNGREAMPHGGALTIETRNVHLAENLCEVPGEAGARPYVRLRVADTGVGMDAHTKQHLFELFFTTKDSSRGTGLGLATVFGIVNQSGGRITVASEPGVGSVFSVYLPRLAGPPRPGVAAGRQRRAHRGSGTVLVVEDQAEVRRLTSMILRKLGYEVLEAADGAAALEVAERHARPIRLLLTDVIMPGMNGKQVAAELVRLQPGIKVIYMSGYPDRIVGEGGELDRELMFLQKPFTPEKLIELMERVLDGSAVE